MPKSATSTTKNRTPSGKPRRRASAPWSGLRRERQPPPVAQRQLDARRARGREAGDDADAVAARGDEQVRRQLGRTGAAAGPARAYGQRDVMPPPDRTSYRCRPDARLVDDELPRVRAVAVAAREHRPHAGPRLRRQRGLPADEPGPVDAAARGRCRDHRDRRDERDRRVRAPPRPPSPPAQHDIQGHTMRFRRGSRDRLAPSAITGVQRAQRPRTRASPVSRNTERLCLARSSSRARGADPRSTVLICCALGNSSPPKTPPALEHLLPVGNIPGPVVRRVTGQRVSTADPGRRRGPTLDRHRVGMRAHAVRRVDPGGRGDDVVVGERHDRRPRREQAEVARDRRSLTGARHDAQRRARRQLLLGHGGDRAVVDDDDLNAALVPQARTASTHVLSRAWRLRVGMTTDTSGACDSLAELTTAAPILIRAGAPGREGSPWWCMATSSRPRLRLACFGLFGRDAGSIASAHARLLGELLDRGRSIDLYAAAGWLPDPGLRGVGVPLPDLRARRARRAGAARPCCRRSPRLAAGDALQPGADPRAAPGGPESGRDDRYDAVLALGTPPPVTLPAARRWSGPRASRAAGWSRSAGAVG